MYSRKMVGEDKVPVEACCVAIYVGGVFKGLLRSGDEGKFYVEKKDSPSEAKEDLQFLFVYHPQIRRMMRQYDIHVSCFVLMLSGPVIVLIFFFLIQVIGLKSLKLQKWISRPHHGHSLKVASRMLDCECFKESYVFCYCCWFYFSLQKITHTLFFFLRKTKDYWKIYTNGLTSPLPLYLGGKEGNKLCFGETPSPPSLCIR